MRLFVAINLAPTLRDAAHAAAAELREVLPGAGWVPPERLHLTVKFLDEQPESRVDELARALGRAAARHAPMSLRLEGAGAFPNLRRPRVVWIGVAPDPRLELLHHDVEEHLATLGVEVEGRPFRPHLTLGRLRAPASPDQVRALAQAARRVRFREESLVESLDLMHSVPGRGGPRYDRLAAAPLRIP